MRSLPVAGRKRLGFSGPACPGNHAARQRSAHSSALVPWPLDTVTWWKSRRPLRGAGAVSNRKSARYSAEAPPPKSLEVEPGNEASQDDVYSLNAIWIM